MDKIRKKRKPKKKKVLLSIVDPWDVRVASVDPLRLAGRRGVSIESLEIREHSPLLDEPTPTPPTIITTPASPLITGSSTSSPPISSLQSPVRTPWPWYKPPVSPTSPRTTPRLPNSSNASPTDDKLGADVPIKPARTKDGEPQQQQQQRDRQQQQRKNDVRQCTTPARPQTVQLLDRKESKRQPNRPKDVELLVLNDLGTNIHATDELAFFDETRRCKELPEPSINNDSSCRQDVDKNDRINEEKSLVNLVEELVLSRYNPTPIVQRKLMRRSPIPGSINHTGWIYNAKTKLPEYCLMMFR